MEKTWLYLKKIKKQKMSFLDVLIFGLLFEIAWIIPGIDIFSLFTPLLDSINFCFSLPFLGLLMLRTYNPQLMFVSTISTIIILSIFCSIVYMFFHCKIYNVVLKKFLNIEEKTDIKKLYAEKTESVKKYFNWELICFFIKCSISIPYFVWSTFFVGIEGRIENMLIALLLFVIFIIVDLYVILTRAFVIPTFLSEKYEELNAKGIFSLSNKLFSIKLFVPVFILLVIYILANAVILIATSLIFVVVEKFISLLILKLALWLLFAVISAILTYRVGLFCFIYSCSCQEVIFPENPLVIANRSDEGKINDVYTIFEEDKFDENQ